MKIVFYSHDWAPKVGGVQAITLTLASGLSEAGCDVTVVTNTASGVDADVLPFPVVRQPGRFLLLRLLRAADVIHLAGPVFFPLLAGSLLGKPTVVEHHGYYSACPNALLLYHPSENVCPGHFLARRYGKCMRCNATNVGGWKSMRLLLGTFPRRWLSRLATQNVGPSEHLGRRVALPRMQTIYHGIAAETLSVAPVRLVAQPVRFAFVGRLVPEKGLPTLLHAARKLTDEGRVFGLKIIGDGPERARLEALAAEMDLQDRIVFTGYLHGEELRAALRDVAATVMPSLCEEVAPLAAIEQMMHGRLLIASDLGGLAEYLGDAGIKFAAGDSTALAACLRRVLEQPEIICERGAAARERAIQLFQQERMVEEHLQLYRRLLAPKSAAEKALARP